MKQIIEDVDEYISMGKQENLAFLDNLYNLLLEKEADAVDYQEVKTLSAAPLCPNCESSNIIKNGRQQGQQLYICKDCGRNFRVTTGTFVYKIQKREKMLGYIRCMLEDKTLQQCADEVGISLPTSFAWRHRILAALRSFDNNVNFFGIIELKQLLMEYSEKGRRKRNAIDKLIAKIRRFQKVAVLATQDRSGNMLFNVVGFQKVRQAHIEKILTTKISKNGVICSDDDEELRNIQAKELRRKEVIKNKKSKNDLYGLTAIEKHTGIFVNWINYKFRGVASKYLQSYIMWYIIKHKYLLNKLIEDVGRMLNLASSDRQAWYVYRELRLNPILILKD
jgi:transposase-like protein